MSNSSNIQSEQQQYKHKPQKASTQLESPLVFYILAKVPNNSVEGSEMPMIKQFRPHGSQVATSVIRTCHEIGC